MREIKITAVTSIWLRTKGGAISECYVIALNAQGYYVGLLQGDQCVVSREVFQTAFAAEGSIGTIVRDNGGSAFHVTGSLYTILHAEALNTSWKFYS